MQLLISLFFLVIYLVLSSNCIIIDTSYGKLEGYAVHATKFNRTIHIFKRVPFAKPPLEELRFALPQPPLKWDGIWDATKFGPGCMENSSLTGNHPEEISEDCLHLNFYTNDYCLEHKNCAAVFYIHGGGFAFDSPVVFHDKRLIRNFPSKDVILILAAYRLGVFSHLTFDDDSVVPRNLAVYDILRGLEFVNQELHNFGGDNKKVTAFGHSSGANLVLQMAFSAKIDPDRKLFQRALSMSPATIGYSLEIKKNLSNEIIKLAGCSSKSISKSVECLRKLDAFKLLKYQRQIEDKGPKVNIFRGWFYVPPLFEIDTFTGLLEEQVKPRNFLLGMTDDEYDFPRMPWEKEPWNDYEEPSAHFLGYKNWQDIQAIIQKDTDNEIFKHRHESMLFFTGAEMTANAMRRLGGDVYLYSISRPGGSSLHTSDRQYIFGLPNKDNMTWYNLDDWLTGEFYADMFASFIKTGDPGHGFEKLKPGLDNYLQITFNSNKKIVPKMKNFYQKESISYFQEHLRKMDAAISYVKEKFFKKFLIK